MNGRAIFKGNPSVAVRGGGLLGGGEVLEATVWWMRVPRVGEAKVYQTLHSVHSSL